MHDHLIAPRALEALALISPSRTPSTLRRHTRAQAERAARTCYDHLAGVLGVAVCDALVTARAIAPDDDRGFALGPRADEAFGALGVALPAPGRRAYARACIDWSERRPHLAGALGAAVADTLLERQWVTRVRGTRALLVSDAGRAGLREALALELA